jgi:ABC-type polysaccharide/polyol phosphate export permease
MRVISTIYHSVIDYLLGIYILCIPMMCDYSITSAEALSLIAVSALLIINGLLGKFDLGYLKAVPNRFHLIIDAIAGLLLFCSPWIFSFSDKCFLPHIAVGVGVFLFAICTKSS